MTVVTVENMEAGELGPEEINLKLGQKILRSLVDAITDEEWQEQPVRKRVTVPSGIRRDRAKAALTMAVKNSPYLVSQWNHETKEQIFYVELKKR